MVRRWVSAACIVVSLVSLPFAAQRASAQDPHYVVIGAGWYDAIVHEDAATTIRVEFRPGYKIFWRIQPLLGVTGTTDGAIYGYGGINADFPLAEFFPDTTWVNRLVFNINLAAGYYDEGDGKDLGNSLEFRTGAELAYEFQTGIRVGGGFYHISNAGTGSENPGTEILSVFVALPL